MEIKINKESVIKAFNEGDETQRTLLKNLFPDVSFVPENIMDRINSWEDVLRETKADPKKYELREDETEDELAYRQGKLIALAYNGGVVPDASNTNQYKYYPWHKIVKDMSHPSGFGLSYRDFGGWYARSTVGVRLCFLDPNHAIDAGKKFSTTVYDKLKIR